jgi:hypothetical protein
MRPVPRTIPALLAVALGCALLLRPIAHGVSVLTVVAFWATTLGLVVAPGVLLCIGGRLCPRGDRWLVVGQGATLGIALHGIAFLAGRWLGVPGASVAVAIVASAAGIGLMVRRRADVDSEPLPARPAAAATLAVALAGCILQPVNGVGALGEPVPFDMLFHAGNAAELRHRWPLEDPRAAGVPLHYHFLGYALPIDAADLVDAPVADTLLGLAPLFWVALLALQTCNAARTLCNDGRAGALAAAVVLLHADPGRIVAGVNAFNSNFAAGVYGSPTTIAGLTLLAGLTIFVDRWLESGSRRQLAAIGLLSLAASATKTTVVPVVVAAAALMAARALGAGRLGHALRWAAVAVLGLAGGLPLTSWQAGGETGYSGLVAVRPLSVFLDSPFAAAVSRLWGRAAVAGPPAVVTFAVWLVGYFALGGIGAAVWLARRERLRETQAWALSVAAVGLLLALLLDVPGLSQLFLLYNGQLLLALFAGAAIARSAAALARPTRASLAVAAVLGLAAVPSLDNLRLLPSMLDTDRRAADHRPSAAERDYVRALAWLRGSEVRDAVVFARNGSTLLSAYGEVRLYYENGTYTTRAWHVAPSAEPWPERVSIRDRLLLTGDPAALAAAHEAIGRGKRLVLVVDNVSWRVESGWVFTVPRPVPPLRFFAPDRFTLRFANGALQVYEQVGGASVAR